MAKFKFWRGARVGKMEYSVCGGGLMVEGGDGGGSGMVWQQCDGCIAYGTVARFDSWCGVRVGEMEYSGRGGDLSGGIS